jgi:hypothetical protein
LLETLAIEAETAISQLHIQIWNFCIDEVAKTSKQYYKYNNTNNCKRKKKIFQNKINLEN